MTIASARFAVGLSLVGTEDQFRTRKYSAARKSCIDSAQLYELYWSYQWEPTSLADTMALLHHMARTKRVKKGQYDRDEHR